MTNPHPGSADTTRTPRYPADGTENSTSVRTAPFDASTNGFTPSTTASSLEPWQDAFPWSPFDRGAASSRAFRGRAGTEVNSEWSPSFPSLGSPAPSRPLQQPRGSYASADLGSARSHDFASRGSSAPSSCLAVDHPPSTAPPLTAHSVFDPWASETSNGPNHLSSARTAFAPRIQDGNESRYTSQVASLASTPHADPPPLPIRSSYAFSNYPLGDPTFSAPAGSQPSAYASSLAPSSNASLLARNSDLRPSSAPWSVAGGSPSAPPHAAAGSHMPLPPIPPADWSAPLLLPTQAIQGGSTRSQRPHDLSLTRESYETSPYAPFPRSWYRARLGTSPAHLGSDRSGARAASTAMVTISGPPQLLSSRSGETRLRSGLPDRSTWAMWCGNIPSDATEAELLDFFAVRGASAATAADLYGVESIHLIARSNCAFVNYSSEFLMQQAITRSNGISLRPNDRRCKPLVCRRRMREDDAKSGVGAQRGAGLHLSYIAAQALDLGKKGVQTTNDSRALDEEAGNSSGDSTASTTSSFFSEYFPKRFFVLKAKESEHLEESIRSGLWSTQGHNEDVLDQAFRTSLEGVFLFFSANRSGGFAGYARMIGPIFSPPRDRAGSRHPNLHVAEADKVIIVAEGGTPFPVHWLSTRRLPFTRTRSILNSFNNNREVKISRDGTEIEPNAGLALLRLWD
ncbi:BZ3500_MvSof-1268-A1-R1_Chr11-2g03372 [Microbotryum saponariae]|uniref:BZ3500_MvSof-1268-A1-R1_Chr11-2g03372 protein n=1 Tax=Microbotryum saponariae TaxID=289078 RepID=A0A2X0KN89_9BASI|nr:BZ3500_MvSof-1268-A1-R1_Chr11-2g03372 [Microbotryum saponariae]SDA03222.1 BZ3501_MvSof-1269-A2-R1_Chr11g02943 [Microbotryum saponariae]